ncbi:unnamed protein product [Blepharisma stoltei]|uniref:C2H2-type domain-containing protein n=1 Tax=Blepharisma stoltei TaxID=1481888 RepID=A0AAU9IVD7_9CILI|nr:unnamed protein product [Blepharisma stoltei]
MDISQEFSEKPSPLPHPISLILVKSTRTRNSIPCTTCGMLFKLKSDLVLHRFSNQEVMMSKDIAKTCSKLVEKEESDLELSDDEEGKEFFCKECNIEFKSRKGMRQHMGKVHDTKYKHSRCSICKKKFRNKYAVKFHWKQVHEKSTRAKCEKCGRVFYNKYLLINHSEKC